MSSSHERDRQTVQDVSAPDVPRRIRSNRVTGSTHRQPAIREIHKNTWLKKLGASEKKGASFIKKVEKFWVVFCVHDDVDAFLEFYTEPKMGAIHKPLTAISVNSCLHVSPSLMGQDNEYEFAVTLPTQVIRLIACNWDQMREWVDSLQGKLREMNILGPKDNVYSALPESHGSPGQNILIRTQNGPGFVTTRDPNSPLPPTPISNISVTSEEETMRTAANIDEQTLREGVEFETGIIQRAVTRQRSPNEMSVLSSSPDLSKISNNEAESHLCPSQQESVINTVDGTTITHQRTLTVACPVRVVEIGNQELAEGRSSIVEDVLNLNLNKFSHARSPHFVSLALSNKTITPNTSVVQVRFEDAVTPLSSNISHNVDNLLGVSVAVLPASSLLRQPSFPGSIISSTQAPSLHASKTQEKKNLPPEEPRQLNPRGNVYEHLLVSANIVNSSTAALNTSIQGLSNPENIIVNSTTNRDCNVEDVTPPAVPKRNLSHSKKINRESVSNSRQRSLSASRKDQQEVNSNHAAGEQHQQESSSNQANQRHENVRADVVRAIDSCAPLSDTAQSFFNRVSPSKECRPVEGIIGVRGGEYRIRRDVVEASSQNEFEQVLGESAHPITAVIHVPLKEQQVMRLQSEINHQGGVRIVLRKKDCVSSIAFVDYLGAVWVTGWKQQQHPVLYYAFHVGDQVLKIGGVTVQNSTEAHRAIKMVSSMQVEFIIKRLPYGSVLVLKRKIEGELLGLVSVGNSGEIGVVSNGLAASQGLQPSSPATDGQSTCNWFLTEINNRPLSLFARETEVRDRLNAVGKEISILVQPADLVKHLRKQLKSVKSFKEYLIV